MSKGLVIHDGTGIIARDPSAGILVAYGSSVPGAVRGYAPGCKFIKVNGTSIGTVEYINVGTFASANFVAAGKGAEISVPFVYGEATPLDAAFWIADKAYTVTSIVARPLVAGTDPSAVTAQIRRAASGTAIASGTALHSGSIDLKGTINTNQTLTLASAGALAVPSGSAIGIDVTGTTTAARGVIMVSLIPQ